MKRKRKPTGAGGGDPEAVRLFLKKELLEKPPAPNFPHLHPQDFNLLPDKKKKEAAEKAAPLLMRYGEKFGELVPLVKAAAGAYTRHSGDEGEKIGAVRQKFSAIRPALGDSDTSPYGVGGRISHFLFNSFGNPGYPELIAEAIAKCAGNAEFARGLMLMMFSTTAVDELVAGIKKLQG